MVKPTPINRNMQPKLGKKHRKSVWNSNPSKMKIVYAAILAFRRDGLTTVRIEKMFNMPPRTLMRYVARSKNPNDIFYLGETEYEKRMNQIENFRKYLADNIVESYELDTCDLDPELIVDCLDRDSTI